MEIAFDTYTRRARLSPALIAGLPLGVVTTLWFPSGVDIWSALWGIIAWCGGTVLIAEFGRSFGKRVEPHLFSEWGGKPTTILLRHRGSRNRALLLRRHELLERVTGLTLPSAEEEAARPDHADDVYDAVVNMLRERTRDQKMFPLVQEENRNYGFRRNLVGLKAVGLSLALAGLASVCIHLIIFGITPEGVLSTLVLLALVMGWVFWFKKDWVKEGGFAYAERLLGAVEILAGGAANTNQ